MRVVPVSGREWNAALLPDDVRFGVSSDLTFEDDASSLHQLLSARLLDEEGSGGLSCAHLRHHLLLRLHGNAGGTTDSSIRRHRHGNLVRILNETHSRLSDSDFSDGCRLLSALDFF